MTIIAQKKALRSSMLGQRSAMDAMIKKEYDQWICNELENHIQQRQCKVVHAYIPMVNEIDIRPLIENMLEQQITVVCPKTLPKRKLENRRLYSMHELETGIMGTQHPAQPELYEGPFDLIIVPGLAFDETRYRLGYGGGYYDGFLFSQPEAYKVGIFYPFQQVATVPLEPHDISLDTILVKTFS
jgi:5-formyltetrahydrofolate cyclo-ligase